MSVRKSWDLVVIGGGVAGITTATSFAASGGSVALIDAHQASGAALATSSIPARALLASARTVHTVRRAGDFGIHVEPPEVDFAAILRRADNITQIIAQRDPPEALTTAGVTPIDGEAHFVDSQTVRVGEDLHIGDQIVIATGSTPTIPDIPGLRRSRMVTSDTIRELSTPPRRMAVIGAGFTGLELGQAFARFGSDVTVIDRNTRIVHTIEPDHADRLRQRLEAEGIRILTDTTVDSVETNEGGDRSMLILDHATGERERLDVDCILVATGRHPNIERLGLDNAGIAVTGGRIELDDLLQTSLEHIWACGDVTGDPNFVNRAEQQAFALTTNLLGGATRWNDVTLPWALFTDPPLAGIGMTRADARAAHGDRLEVLRFSCDQLDRAITDGDADGEIMVLLKPGRFGWRGGGEFAGAHVIGAHADDLINQFAPFVRWRVPARVLANTAQVYPTHAHGIRQAMALHWRDDHQSWKPTFLSRVRRWWRD